nr:uncharacterized protein LOC107376811 [Nothobranchius furzeri]
MKLRSICLLLGVSIQLLSGRHVSAVSLNVSPNLQQFFSGQSVSLSCLGQGQEPGWTRRMSKGRQTEQCGAAGSDFGVFNESSCVLDLLSSYTGVYWCETSSGQKSEQINITVTRKEDSVLILEIPALPVSTGSDITLRCRHKDGSLHAAYFYKNNDIIGNAVKTLSTAIHGAQPSDEGFYSCSTDKSGSSPQSFLRVKDPPVPHTITTSPPSASATPHPSDIPPPISVLHLLCHLLAICPYCVCSILLLSICCRMNSGSWPAVSMETTHLDEERGDVTAGITTEHDF